MLPLGAQCTMVGKASIKESHQLRSMHIQEPWAAEAGAEISPQSLEEPYVEQSSPPLGTPPEISPGSEAKLELLLGSIPLPDSEISGNQWGTVASLGAEPFPVWASAEITPLFYR